MTLPAKKPNVVLILNDDMGFSDIGCYGGEVADAEPRSSRRPGGLRYSQFYNTARCSSLARVAAHRSPPAPDRHRHPDLLDFGPEGYAGNLNDRCVTIRRGAQGQAGYGTYHLRQVAHRREPHGADRCLAAAARLRQVLRHDHRRWQLLRPEHADPRQRQRRARKPSRTDDNFFYTDAISDRGRRPSSVSTAREQGDKPFFQYVAYTAPHWPLHAHEEDIAKYKGRFDAGWDQLRDRIGWRSLDRRPGSSCPSSGS